MKTQHSQSLVTMPSNVREALDAQREAILGELIERRSQWFDQEMEKLDHWAEDKRAGLKLDLKDLDGQVRELKQQIRRTGNLPDKLALQREIRELEKKRDEAARTTRQRVRSKGKKTACSTKWKST